MSMQLEAGYAPNHKHTMHRNSNGLLNTRLNPYSASAPIMQSAKAMPFQPVKTRNRQRAR